jgi:hypothetical protein
LAISRGAGENRNQPGDQTVTMTFDSGFISAAWTMWCSKKETTGKVPVVHIAKSGRRSQRRR